MSGARKVQPTPDPIVVTEGLAPDSLLSMVLDSGCSHLCQKNGHHFDREMRASNNILQSSENLLIHPLSSILMPDQVGAASERSLLLLESQFDSSAQKQGILDNLVKAGQTKGLPKTIEDDMVAVADELFTNAVYNAPFVDLQTHKNPGMSRQGGEVKMGTGKSGRIFLGKDATSLVVGCHDPFGSLELTSYVKKILGAYRRGLAAAINFGPGGAGLGSYIIFNAGSSLFVGVWPGRATILCCVIPLGLSNRRRNELAKHFHCIRGEGEK